MTLSLHWHHIPHWHIPHWHHTPHGLHKRLVYGITFFFICFLFGSLLWYRPLSSHCAGIAPISSPEYHARQTNLAKTLYTLNASAYITEPSANSQFFANFSTTQWFLSERPLLLILTPSFDPVDGSVEAKVTILTPQVKSLP